MHGYAPRPDALTPAPRGPQHPRPGRPAPSAARPATRQPPTRPRPGDSPGRPRPGDSPGGPDPATPPRAPRDLARHPRPRISRLRARRSQSQSPPAHRPADADGWATRYPLPSGAWPQAMDAHATARMASLPETFLGRAQETARMSTSRESIWAVPCAALTGVAESPRIRAESCALPAQPPSPAATRPSGSSAAPRCVAGSPVDISPGRWPVGSPRRLRPSPQSRHSPWA